MKFLLLIISSLSLVYMGCGSKGGEGGSTLATNSGQVNVQKADGSVKSLKYQLTQNGENIELQMALDNNGCKLYAMQTNVAAIEPLEMDGQYMRENGGFKVKASFVPSQYSEHYSYAYANQSRYIYFLAKKVSKDSGCEFSGKSSYDLSEAQVSEAAYLMDSISMQLGLSAEEQSAMQRSADFQSQIITMKLGESDNVRVMLDSNTLNPIGIAFETTVFGFKDLRLTRANLFTSNSETTPEAMPVAYSDADSRMQFQKEHFKQDLKRSIPKTREFAKKYNPSKESEEVKYLISMKSKKFGGENEY